MKIIVLTPVKNEEWILDRFLRVTSSFADHIIIADQQSEDSSLAICKKYPKVHLVQNTNKEYSEASRQLLLIEEARKLVKEPSILLALDADEIMAADAMQSPEWQTMLNAKPGTVLYFEKPDLFDNGRNVIRYNNLHPIGFVDDGSEHKPDKIHSMRIPMPENHEALQLNQIKILHYGYSRLNAQKAKLRYYSMLENIYSSKNVYRRYQFYGRERNYSKEGILEKTNQNWIQGWEEQGIDMTSILTKKYFWQDRMALQLFNKHGEARFHYDDIWNFDWEACRVYFSTKDASDIPVSYIPKQSLFRKLRYRAIIWMCKRLYFLIDLVR